MSLVERTSSAEAARKWGSSIDARVDSGVRADVRPGFDDIRINI